MADGPDRRAFDVVTTPFNTSTPEFGIVAKVVAAADTLEAFLRDIRAKFPEMTAPAAATMPAAQPAEPATPAPRAAAPAGQPG